MAATSIQTIVNNIRLHLIETTASFWSDAELAQWVNYGCQDMWRAINDLHQEHFLTVDTTNVWLRTGDLQLSGVPADCYRIHLIEPADTTINSSSRNMLYVPRDYNTPEFQYARSLDGQDPTQAQIIYYCAINAGSPAGPTTILTAPKITATVQVRFVYVPTLASVTISDNNPIPGQSDNALVAWGLAYARAKESENRAPDAAWLTVYATEKQNILTSLTPRQDQEPDVVPGFFEFYQNF